MRLSALLLAAVLVLSLTACGSPDASESSEASAADSIAAGVPGTDVYLASYVETGDSLSVGPLQNATARPGYDNQPSFEADGSLLYTAITDGQADVFRMVPQAGTSERVTDTPQSEYSPTPRADGRFTVVRVEDDGRQRLWQYAAFGRPVAAVLPEADSIGYHAWIDSARVAAFVLQRPRPPALRVYDVTQHTDTLVTEGIGRSMHAVPGQNLISFVSVAADSTTSIHVLDPRTLSTRRLVPTPGGGRGEDHAWTPGGTLLMADGTTLYAARPFVETGDAPDAWTAVRDLDVTAPSRLAVGDSTLAVVAED